MAVRPTFRFAPSPNGKLHLGHAYSALRNRHLADERGGALLLRIEDIDVVRCTPAFEAAIQSDLTWLGIKWQGPVRRQSEHFACYAAALGKLTARGLVYPCFCTRGDIARALAGRLAWRRDPDGSPLYPGTCRELGHAERARRMARDGFCLRLDLGRAVAALGSALSWAEYHEGPHPVRMAAIPELWGDAVLRRKDIPTSYHVAVVVDDALQGVTEVVRGEDLLQATSLHRLLQALLDLPEPVYHHHRLLRDAAGHKLSKSRGSKTLAEWREQGLTPKQVRRLVEGLAGPP